MTPDEVKDCLASVMVALRAGKQAAMGMEVDLFTPMREEDVAEILRAAEDEVASEDSLAAKTTRMVVKWCEEDGEDGVGALVRGFLRGENRRSAQSAAALEDALESAVEEDRGQQWLPALYK